MVRKFTRLREERNQELRFAMFIVETRQCMSPDTPMDRVECSARRVSGLVKRLQAFVKLECERRGSVRVSDHFDVSAGLGTSRRVQGLV